MNGYGSKEGRYTMERKTVTYVVSILLLLRGFNTVILVS